MKSKKKFKKSFLLNFVAFSIRTVGNISPHFGAKALALFWFKVSRLRENEERAFWVKSSQRHEVIHRGKNLSVYSRVPTAPRGQVLLLHGWSGRWDQLVAIANSLFESGFEVIVFDFPSHGENIGKETDVFEMSELLKSVFSSFKLDAPILICHSVAFLTVVHGMRVRSINCSKLITINSPSRFSYLIDVFRKKIGFSTLVDDELWKIIDRRVGVIGAKAQLATDHMKLISSDNVLIIHDEEDKEVDFEESVKLSKIWPESKRFITRGLGHTKILFNQEVVKRINLFCQGDINES
jgi:hypothetical protein